MVPVDSTSHLPVLDISNPTASTAYELVDAVSKYGFVYIQDNIIPAGTVNDMFDLSSQFFKSPHSEKQEFSVSSKGSGKNGGWFGMNTEKLDPETQKRGDFKEAFNFNEFPVEPSSSTEEQPLPPALKASKSEITSFATSCHQVCMRILELFAQGLEIEESAGGRKWFEDRHDRSKGSSGTVLRFLYYPALPPSSSDAIRDNEEDGDLRCGAHSDYGSVTLLFRKDLPGQAGLEILTENGTWATVPINPSTTSSPASSSIDSHSEPQESNPPILVNVGDLLSFWTNGLLKSTVHRVIFPNSTDSEANSDRYSIAYFCHPLDQARLEGVPSQIVTNSGNGIERKVMTAKEHLESRLAATYT